MTVRDVWQTNPMFRLVMTIIAGVGVTAIAGLVVLYAEVKTNTALLQDVRAEVQQIQRDFGGRLRDLERSRRGYVPGEP